MGVSNYGLWKGTPTSWDGKADNDHGHLKFTDGTANKTYEADVNIMSSGKDTRLVYWLASSFDASHPSTNQLQALPKGFSAQKGSSSLALDYMREGFIDLNKGTLLSHDPKNSDEKNDILSYLDPVLTQAVKENATIYIWGSKYSDSDGSSGIHDIHMNQGNSGNFAKENGTYQDGGIVIEFANKKWKGIFLAFATQTLKTDDNGNAEGETFAEALSDSLSNTSTSKAEADHTTNGSVGIEAALVNPIGPDSQGGEMVYVQNKSSKAQSLGGWRLENEKGEGQDLESAEISANTKKSLKVSGWSLSDKSGKIFLKDAQGETVSEVSYTERDAGKEGRLLYFAQ